MLKTTRNINSMSLYTILCWLAIGGVLVRKVLADHQQGINTSYQVFGFTAADKPDFSNYDWNTLTTVAWNTDHPKLVELAHAHGTHMCAPVSSQQYHVTHPYTYTTRCTCGTGWEGRQHTISIWQQNSTNSMAA